MDEDGGHCFLKCKYVKKCWRMMCLEHVRTSLLEATTSAQMVCMILEREVNERLNIVALLWAWWDARNKTNVGEQHMSCEEVIHKATVMVTDMLTVGRNKPKQDTTARKRCVRPPEDKLKINCDGAFVQSEKIGGWGFVIKNHDGEGVLADSMSLISGLRTAAFDQAACGVLLRGIHELIQEHFVEVDVCHVPTQCNGCAHMLASFRLSGDPDLPTIWNDPLPEFVIYSVSRDLIDCGHE
ncbi:hypothetical protein BS78_07G059300 [Paspalum vaginatum]|nr:hypothetical protein BS78_07G059300 [Paspalum vaginatum]